MAGDCNIAGIGGQCHAESSGDVNGSAGSAYTYHFGCCDYSDCQESDEAPDRGQRQHGGICRRELNGRDSGVRG